MKIKELINNPDFDLNCSFQIREFQGESGESETVFDSRERNLREARLFGDEIITYISTFTDIGGCPVLIIEYDGTILPF